MEFWEAVEYFSVNHRTIRKKFTGKWVAILDGEVIDNDEDLGDLTSRVRRSFPGRDPYMPYAGPKPLEEIFAGYETQGDVDWERIREEGEAEAADEMIRRMHENMKYNLNG
jgi:hypothetical protein